MKKKNLLKERKMKRTLTTAAAAILALSTAVSAMTLDHDAYTNMVHKFVPEADLSEISDATIVHILSVITDDRDMTPTEVADQIRSILKNVKN